MDKKRAFGNAMIFLFLSLVIVNAQSSEVSYMLSNEDDGALMATVNASGEEWLVVFSDPDMRDYTGGSLLVFNINQSGGGGGGLSTNILYFTCGENADLDPGSEWSCGGNGETNQNFYFWDDVTATGLAIDCNVGTGTAVIAVQDDEVSTACQLTSTTTNDATTCDVDIDAGSWVRPYTVSDSGHSQCVVTMRFETR